MKMNNMMSKQDTPERQAFVKIILTIQSCKELKQLQSCERMLETYEKRFPENVGLTILESVLIQKYAQTFE